MNDNSNSTGIGSMLGRHKFVWLVLLPLLVFLVVAVYWGVTEWNAGWENRMQFEQLAAAGIPYDNATLQEAYDSRTHPEGTSDWLRCIESTDWCRNAEAYKKLPYLGYEGEDPKNLVPGGTPDDWPGESLVGSFLEEMKPVINLVEQASSHPNPVRFPIKFRSVDTLLPHIQSARSILRLLSLDCDYAYFNQDNQRAMRDLSLMKATGDAFDGRSCLVSELVNLALRGIRSHAIRRTLTHSQWSAADLSNLRDSMAMQGEISARWQELMIHERAFGLAYANEPAEKLAQMTDAGLRFAGLRLKLSTGPSEVKTLLEAYQRMIELPTGSDVSQWRKRSAALEEWFQTLPANSLAGMLAPATAHVLEAEIRSEEIRRWTLTAIAIQQFKLENGQWPEELTALELVGLNYEDYSDTTNTVFGYEIEGDKVFLWKRPSEITDDSRISKTRPVPGEENDDLSDFVAELN